MVKKILLSVTVGVLLFSGCSTKTLNDDYVNYSQESLKNMKDGDKKDIFTTLKKDEIIINKNYLDLSIAKDLSSALSELGSINNRIYLLNGEDILLNKSNASEILNIKNFFDLKEYIEDTTNYTISVVSNRYKNNRVKKVVVIDKEAKKAGFDNIEFRVDGKQSISTALSSLAKKIGYSVVYSDDLFGNKNNSFNNRKDVFLDKDITYNGHNINNFLRYIEKNFDVFADIDYGNKIISIKKYKSQIFNISAFNIEGSTELSTSGLSTSTGLSSSESESTQETVSSDTGKSSSKNKITTKGELEIKENLKEILKDSHNSKIVFNLDSGQVIVKTTNKNMSEIKAYIDRINAINNQQVDLEITIYEFVLNRDFNFGTDLNIQGSKVNFTTTNLIKTIVKGNFTHGNTLYEYSVNSENKFLRYSKSYSYKQTLTNNLSEMITLQNTKDYVKAINSTTTTNTATTTAVQTEISSVNQGVNIAVIPRILGDKISLKTNIKMNSINDLHQHTDSSGNIIYLPDIDEKIIPTQLILKSGERRVLGSYQDYQDVKSYTGIAPIEDFMIGGNSGKKFIKKEIIIVVSAKIIK